MDFKQKVKLYLGESQKIRTAEEIHKLCKDTAKILGTSPSKVREYFEGIHSEDGPGLGINIVTPKQLAKEIKEYEGEIK